MPVSDNESAKKLRTDAEALRAVARLRPLIRHFGKTGRKVAEALDQVPELYERTQELVTAPDRFNAFFLEHGFIHFESMNADAASNALSLAEAGDVAAGVQSLVDYWTAEEVGHQLRRMFALAAYRDRDELLQRALTDFAGGNYHACIPVVIAQFDGLGKDLGVKGFNKREAKRLVAHDSISAHPEALPRLVALMSEPRSVTTTARIEIPYRHGILHGRDLGYANQHVATKAWAAFFSLRDWALKAEQGRLDPPPPTAAPTWRETWRKIRTTAEQNRALRAWMPRTAPTISLTPPAGGTPEAVVEDFLQGWRRRDVKIMAAHSAPMWFHNRTSIEKFVDETYLFRSLESWKLQSVDDTGPGVSRVTVDLLSAVGPAPATMQVAVVTVAYQDKQGGSLIRGTPGVRWGVTVVSFATAF